MAAEQIEALEQEIASGQSQDTNVELPPSSEPRGPSSTFEKLCETYISNRDRSPKFVDRLAYEMNRDERVRKICRVKLRQNKCDLNDFEEVLQRVLEVFFGSMLAKIEDHDAVYAVVYAVAHNVSREVLRDRQKLVINHRSIEEMHEKGEELEQVGLADQVEVDHDRDIDTEAATIRMAAALKRVINGEQTVASSGIYAMDQDPMVRLVQPQPADVLDIETEDSSQNTPPPSAPGTKRPRGGSRAELSVDQQELVKIGSDLGLRNQDYAFALGIGLPRLSSYIYGRTASVPIDVMEKARSLLAEEPHRMARLKRFNRPMDEILKEWEGRLNPTGDEHMASMLGVTKMTIYRWRNNETKPDSTALARYEQWIDEYEKRIERAVEQRLAAERS